MHLEPFHHLFWTEAGLLGLTFDSDFNFWGFKELSSSPGHVRRALSTTMELYAQVSPETPMGYRSIGYVVTPLLVELLGEIGMPISCNYNAAYASRAPSLSGLQKPFRWPTGLIELPVACLERRGRMVPYNFNVRSLLEGTSEECAEHHKQYLDTFFSLYGDDAVAVMVLHSWSFFRMDENGQFNILDESAPEKFEAILRTLSPTTQFITIKDVFRDLDTLLPDLPVRLADSPTHA
jgi:hypothetical protein